MTGIHLPNWQQNTQSEVAWLLSKTHEGYQHLGLSVLQNLSTGGNIQNREVHMHVHVPKTVGGCVHCCE